MRKCGFGASVAVLPSTRLSQMMLSHRGCAVSTAQVVHYIYAVAVKPSFYLRSCPFQSYNAIVAETTTAYFELSRLFKNLATLFPSQSCDASASTVWFAPGIKPDRSLMLGQKDFHLASSFSKSTVLGTY